MKTYLLLIALFLCSFSTDLFSSSKRMVMVEEVTSGNCGSCASQNVAFNAYLSTNKDKAIAVIYHSNNNSSEPMYDINPNMLGPRIWGNYISGTLGTPAAWVNGTKLTTLSTLSSTVSSASGKTSPISLWVFEHRSANKCTLDVIIESDQAFDPNEKLAMVINEEHLTFTSGIRNGEKDFYWVARDMIPGPDKSQALALSSIPAGKKASFSYIYTMNPAWNASEIYVVAFVQNYASKEIMQCALTSPESMAIPKAELGSSSVGFGQVSSDKPMTVTLKNDGLARLKLTGITIENDYDHAFEITSGSNLSELLPGAEQDIEITFTPKANKQFTATLKILSNASPLSIPISGEGSGVEIAPKIKADFTALDFGTTGTSVTSDLVLTNKGLAPLEFTAFTITNDADGAFQVLNPSTSPLQPDASYTLQVKFSPIDKKYYSANLKITSTATNNPVLTIPLSGQGSGASAKNYLTVISASLDFGKVDSNKTIEIKYTNSGYGDLEIQKNSIEDDAYSVFKITQNMETTLNHGDTAYIQIKFTPKENKIYTANFKITSNAENGIEKLVPISGEGDGFVGVNDNTSDNPILSASPNPANDKMNLTLQSLSAGSAGISIVNSIGAVCSEFDYNLIAGENIISVDISKLSHGTYFITVVQNREIFKTSFSK